MNELTHFDAAGNAVMVDVSQKTETLRCARAEARVLMRPETLEKIRARAFKKGDVLAVAQLAGVMAVKRTADLVPLCHPLPITHARVDLEPDTATTSIRILAEVKTLGVTGVEMEALTAASVAALTVYDMCKAVDRGMEITDLRLVFKDGGASGRYEREAPAR